MQLSPTFPFSRPQHPREQICVECGHRFQPRPAGEDPAGEDNEELCNLCYEAQFQPTRLRHWQELEHHPRQPR